MFSGTCTKMFTFLLFVGLQNSWAFSHIITSKKWKRESCGSSLFKCGSGECISSALLCDGETNCKDRSDETSDTCFKVVIPALASYLNPPLSSYIVKCPPESFQCNNGKCIFPSQRCDTNMECNDKGCEMSCRNEEFKCQSGHCVTEKVKCNGSKDCPDGSDETFQLCQTIRCSDNQFKCNYGACVPINSTCDGTANCADESDEASELCTSQVSTVVIQSQMIGCKLPTHPLNGSYQVGGCELPSCNSSSGTVVPNSAILNFTCNQGFKLSGQQVLLCYNDVWSSSFPECTTVTCPAVENPTRRFDCVLSGSSVNCQKPMLPGTKVRIQCENFHIASSELVTYDITCQESGYWSNIVHSCSPECGHLNPEGLPFIAHGRETKFVEFPWHVGIYKSIEKNFHQICGGSIISPKIIVTAAHCFYNEMDGKISDFKHYKIAAGKYFRDWGNKTQYFQESNVSKIDVFRTFRGIKGLYAEDIAVVILETPFKMNEAVRPICIDLEGRYSEDFKPTITGIVLGWGYTEKQVTSEKLHAVVLPYVERSICIERGKESFIPFLNVHDKFCVGTDTGKSVCPGDSGGGFAVKFNDGKYYLMGIVSAGVVPKGSDYCDITHFSTFTRVSDYYSFIRKHLFT